MSLKNLLAFSAVAKLFT